MAGVIGKRLQTCGYALFRWRGKQTGRAFRMAAAARPQNNCRLVQRRRPCSRTANTCANLLKDRAAWHFLKNPAVPPTNNAAERALRGS